MSDCLESFYIFLEYILVEELILNEELCENQGKEALHNLGDH